jgi:HSP20 family molecular chaperone IbpA
MKKKNDLNEFLKQLREAIENILDESGAYRPIIIDISVNVCPNLDVMPAGICVVKAEKVPVDVIETEKKILATIGLSGIEKDNIMISCNGKVLEINASNAMKTLNERIELPSKVVKKGMKATFNNGILEVVFNKSKRKSIKKE